MAKKKASRPTQPASPSQKRKGNGNGNSGKQAPIAPSGLKAFVPPADSQSSQPQPITPSGVAGEDDARVARLESVVGNLTQQMGQLIDAVKSASHQPRYQETVTPPTQAIPGAPQPIQQPMPAQSAGIVQGGPQPITMEAGDDQREVAEAPAVHPRAEGGRQARFDTCAACGQRIKLGTVALATNEYVPSGMTTKWFRLQQNILVKLAEDNFTKTYQVSGNWLADTLAKRQYGERATSVPGFLCGENTSQHPTVKLVKPLMRRATDDEERSQYAGRVMVEARRLQEAGLA